MHSADQNCSLPPRKVKWLNIVTCSGGMKNDFLRILFLSLYYGGKGFYPCHMYRRQENNLERKIKMLFYWSSKHIIAMICCFSSDNILKGIVSAQRHKLNLSFIQHLFVDEWF